MSSYSQILKAESQGRRQLWFIAGPEKALVQDAYELACDHARSDASDVAQTVFVGGTCSGAEVARRLRENGHERSLVVLLDAEKFNEWDVIEPLLRRIPRTDYFIAVSNEDAPDEGQRHIALFRGSQKVRYVLCKPFDADTTVEWIGTRLNIQHDAARFLAGRARGDMEWLLNVVRKLETLDDFVGLALVEKIITSAGTPAFRDSLLNYRKREAVQSLQFGVPNSREVGAIVEDVRKASLIREAMRTVGYFSLPRLRERTKLTNKTISEYRGLSQLYDRANSFRSMKAVSGLHERLVRQDRSAWLSLVAKW